MLQASDALEQGDFDLAIDLYGEALEVEPDNVEAITYRAWARYRQDPTAVGGRENGVVEDFAEASAFEPDYPDARVFAAIVRADRDEPVEAAEQIRAFDATESDAFMGSLVESRNLRETIAGAVFTQTAPPTIDESPYDTGDVVALARSSADKQMVGEALTLFGVVLGEEPNNVEALTYQGWMFARIVGEPPPGLELDAVDGFTNDAFFLLDSAIEIDPDYPDPWAFRAFLNNALGDFEGAKRDVEAFLALPDLPPEILVDVENPTYGLLDLLDD